MSIQIYQIGGSYIGTASVCINGIKSFYVTPAEKSHSLAFDKLFSYLFS